MSREDLFPQLLEEGSGSLETSVAF
jgi:hypothetical protein